MLLQLDLEIGKFCDVLNEFYLLSEQLVKGVGIWYVDMYYCFFVCEKGDGGENLCVVGYFMQEVVYQDYFEGFVDLCVCCFNCGFYDIDVWLFNCVVLGLFGEFFFWFDYYEMFGVGLCFCKCFQVVVDFQY